MKKARGRPPRDDADIALVRAVREAMASGLAETVEQACAYYRKEHGPGVGTRDYLARRYHRISREYVMWEPAHSSPLLRVLCRIYGLTPCLTRMRFSAVIELRRRPHQKKDRRTALTLH